MPVDHKRINGPEVTVPYSLFSNVDTKSLTQQFNETLHNAKRNDLRTTSEHRKIFIKTGVVSQAKGSAYIEVGETKVIVSVFDPREISNKVVYSLKGELYCKFKYAPFSCGKRRLHQQDNEEKHYSGAMKIALESAVCRHEFPNFQVDVYALVLHNDGSALSAAITAAGVALSHAGVPMYDVITSVTIGVQQDTMLLDPNMNEESLCDVPLSLNSGKQHHHGIIILSLLSVHEQLSPFHKTGNFTFQQYSDSLNVATKACQDIVPLVQNCLVKHVIKSVKSNLN